MFDTFESGLGLEIVIWFQGHGNVVLDLLAKGVHFCGSPVRLLVLVPILYWKVDRRMAWQFFMALLLSIFAVVVFKELFHAPRPHLAYPNDVQGLVTQDGYGFPSGHVITAVMLSALVVRWVNERWVWFAALGYVMMIAWARMYVGVHYPQDVLGGLLIGVVLTILYHRLLDRLDRVEAEGPEFSSPHHEILKPDRT